MRALRTRLLLVVLGAVTIAFAALIVGFNVVLAHRLSNDADAVLRARATGALSSITTQNGRLVMREAPDEGAIESQIWVFAGHRRLEAPHANPVIDRAASALAGGPRTRLEITDHDVRLYAVPVTSGGKRVGTVVTGVSLVPYEHTQHVALVSSLILFAVLLLLVAVVARWMVTLALRPVARMTAQADDWSEHDLDRRFALGEPRDELTTLAHTLDNLLGRVAASLRREQRFSSEMSHELRTPLAKVRVEAELALRHERTADTYRDALRHVLAGADQMERIIDTMLVVAREEASGSRGTADALEAAERAAESCAALAQSRGVDIDVSSAGPPARVAGDTDLIERILVPVIENACRYGKGHVSVSSEQRDGADTFTVVDDGPGVTEAEADRIFEPGERGSAGRHNGVTDGAGLGLALARRLARAAKGDVDVSLGGEGARFTIVLPAV
jgi:signal transduction histidine kinase